MMKIATQISILKSHNNILRHEMVFWNSNDSKLYFYSYKYNFELLNLNT